MTRKPSTADADSTVAVAEAVLLAGTGSVWSAESVAVLVIVPAVVAVTTMLTEVLAPTAPVPRLQVMVVVPVQLALEAVGTKVTPAGRVSVMIALVAGLGPLFVAVKV